MSSGSGQRRSSSGTRPEQLPGSTIGEAVGAWPTLHRRVEQSRFIDFLRDHWLSPQLADTNCLVTGKVWRHAGEMTTKPSVAAAAFVSGPGAG